MWIVTTPDGWVSQSKDPMREPVLVELLVLVEVPQVLAVVQVRKQRE
jgi:hypothetical protein